MCMCRATYEGPAGTVHERARTLPRAYRGPDLPCLSVDALNTVYFCWRFLWLKVLFLLSAPPGGWGSSFFIYESLKTQLFPVCFFFSFLFLFPFFLFLNA